jgi:hypothetical protein
MQVATQAMSGMAGSIASTIVSLWSFRRQILR